MAKTRDDIEKVSINLFAGDYARMQSLYPALTAGVAIRKLIRKHLETVEAAAKGKYDDRNISITELPIE